MFKLPKNHRLPLRKLKLYDEIIFLARIVLKIDVWSIGDISHLNILEFGYIIDCFFKTRDAVLNIFLKNRENSTDAIIFYKSAISQKS